MSFLYNVIGLSPFFDNPNIAEDRGEDNENDFSENGESVPYMFIFLDQKNHFEREVVLCWFLFETVFFVETIHTSICLSELLTSSVEWV